MLTARSPAPTAPWPSPQGVQDKPAGDKPGARAPTFVFADTAGLGARLEEDQPRG
jgi:hypothetical protein